MEAIKVEVKNREERGKGPNRRLRAAGDMPATIYDKNREQFHVKLPTKNMNAILEQGFTYNMPIELALDDKIMTAFIKEIQFDPITDLPLHVDFYAVAPDQKITLPISVVCTGIPEDFEKIGDLQQLTQEITVEGLVPDIPLNIEVDVSAMNVGDKIKIEDVEISDNIHVFESQEQILFQVSAAKKVYIDEIEEEE